MGEQKQSIQLKLNDSCNHQMLKNDLENVPDSFLESIELIRCVECKHPFVVTRDRHKGDPYLLGSKAMEVK